MKKIHLFDMHSRLSISILLLIVLFCIFQIFSHRLINIHNWQIFLITELAIMLAIIMAIITSIVMNYEFFHLKKLIQKIMIVVILVTSLAALSFLSYQTIRDLYIGVHYYMGQCEVYESKSRRGSSTYHVQLKDKDNSNLSIQVEDYTKLIGSPSSNGRYNCKGKFNFVYLKNSGSLLEVD